MTASTGTGQTINMKYISRHTRHAFKFNGRGGTFKVLPAPTCSENDFMRSRMLEELDEASSLTLDGDQRDTEGCEPYVGHFPCIEEGTRDIH
jgi:hypothetical protein